MTRVELYELVWSEPVTELSARLGRSDRGLSKLCKRYSIPVPPRGYWARRLVGRAPVTPMLPRPHEDTEIAEFRAFDGQGAKLPIDAMPHEWVIPGVLRRVFSEFLPTANAKRVHQKPGRGLRSQKTGADDLAKARGKQVQPSTASTAAKQQPTASANAANGMLAVARHQEYERAMEWASKQVDHERLLAFLGALDATAQSLEPSIAATLQDWVRTVRLEAAATAPVSLAIAHAEAISTGKVTPGWR